MKVCLLLMCFVCATALAVGPETSQLPMPGRVRGMGGAVTSLAEPLTAPLVQPASISYLEKEEGVWSLPHIIFEYSSGFATFFNNIETPMTVVAMKNAAAASPDQYNHFMIAGVLGRFKKNIAYGIVPDYTFDALWESSTSKLHQSNYFTSTAFLNVGKAFGEAEEFSIGMTGKLSYRIGSEQIYDQTQIDSSKVSLTDRAREALGFGVDMGVLYRLDLNEEFVLSFGGAVLNLGALPYFIHLKIIDPVDNGNPRLLDMQANLGASVLWKKFSFGDWRFTADAKHLTRFGQINLDNHIALGSEFRFKKWLSILGGMQGLGWSGGFELRYWLIDFHFIAYNEDVSRQLAADKRNLRWQLEIRAVF